MALGSQMSTLKERKEGGRSCCCFTAGTTKVIYHKGLPRFTSLSHQCRLNLTISSKA
ncbi:rCG61602 [Rattus norvegicus]|uniref:RCG61602 n=1 Tax=Rattus norvegicus TaxID=10116 RepID=A6HC83_RAT|nr:rCG61602 [Rattus norvegicus]